MKYSGSLLFSPAVFFITADVCFAAGGSYTADQWVNLVWRLLTFGIFCYIIYRYGGKTLAGIFSGRRREIENQLTELSERKEQAEARLAEVEEKIAHIEQERDAIMREARSRGEALQAALIEKGHASAAKIKKQAELTAASEQQAALRSLRAEMAEQVVEAARELVSQKLVAADHDNLVEKSLIKVVPR